MSSSFPFVPHISVLHWICYHLLYWGSSTSVNPLCSLSVYTFRLESDWLSASMVMPNLKYFLGLLTAAHLFLLLEECLNVAKRQCFLTLISEEHQSCYIFANLCYKQDWKIVRYLESKHSLFWWTTEHETEVFWQISTVSVTWKRTNYETKYTTLRS